MYLIYIFFVNHSTLYVLIIHNQGTNNNSKGTSLVKLSGTKHDYIWQQDKN